MSEISDVEKALADLYVKLKTQQPNFDCKIVAHPDFIKAAGLRPGDLVTEYKVPIFADDKITITDCQSDIWIVGKPRQKRKFRRYQRRQDIK